MAENTPQSPAPSAAASPAASPVVQPPQGEVVVGFNALLGFRIAEWRDGFARLELEIAAFHLNRSQLLHGGVIATLIDAACGYTGVHPIEPGVLRRAVTLSLTTSYLGQARAGLVTCTAHRRGGGKTVFMANAEVRDAAGELLAMGEGVYRHIPEKLRA